MKAPLQNPYVGPYKESARRRKAYEIEINKKTKLGARDITSVFVSTGSTISDRLPLGDVFETAVNIFF